MTFGWIKFEIMLAGKFWIGNKTNWTGHGWLL